MAQEEVSVLLEFTEPGEIGCAEVADAYRELVASGWSVAELAALTPADWFVVAALAGDR